MLLLVRGAAILASYSHHPMPLLTILCSNCQRNIEVELTSLAHNSSCPHCGKALAKAPEPVPDPRLVVLEHVRDRIRRDPKKPTPRRRRLLSPDPEDEELKPETATPEPQPYEPQVMNDDVHERMLFDPEVQVRIKWLRWGGGILAGLLLFTIVADRMKWWTSVSQYFAGLTERVLRTAESYRSASDANKNDPYSLPKAKPVAKTSADSKVASVKINSDGLQFSSNDLTPKTNQAAALKAVESFLKAPSLQERVKYVRQQELWGPRMREYYVRYGDGPVRFDRVEAPDNAAQSETDFTFSVVLQDGQRRSIKAGKSNTGDFLVDWASFVIYSEMDWDKFRSRRPMDLITFRVLAMPSDYFKNGFSDSKNLICLKLANPLNSAKLPLYAYADRNGAVGRSLSFILQTYSGKAVPLILRLKYPSQSDQENQVLIGEFVGEGWVARSW